MRGFIFFKVYRTDRRVVLLLVLIMMMGAVYYPLYFVQRERAAVQALSWSVASRVIIVDPGHGGVDPGCASATGVLEKEINLAIARKLVNLLSQAGAVAVLTRDGDYDLSEKPVGVAAHKVDDLEARVELVEKYQADLFLSVHVNSIPSPEWWGAQVFYPFRGTESKRLAALIQQEFLKSMGESYRWVKPADFYVLRNAKVPAVMVETGFISHPREGVLLTDPVYQEKVAWCIYAGMVRYYTGEPLPKSPY